MNKNILLYTFFILFIGLLYSCQKVDENDYKVLYSVHSKNPITVTYSDTQNIRTISQNNGVWSTSFNVSKEKYPGFIVDIKVITKGDFYVNIYQNKQLHRTYKSYDSIHINY